METAVEVLELHEGLNEFAEGSILSIYFNNDYKVSMFADNITLHTDKNIMTVNGTTMFIHDISRYSICKKGDCVPTIDIYIN